jgi:hypothetical protein
MKKNNIDSLILFYNSTSDDKKAAKIISKSGIPCQFIWIEKEYTPKLLNGYHEIRGLKAIETFVNNWKNNK